MGTQEGNLTVGVYEIDSELPDNSLKLATQLDAVQAGFRRIVKE